MREDAESAIGRQLGYWTETLKGLPEQIDLPSDRPRPAVSSYRGESLPLKLTAQLHAGLLELSRASGASLFMVLQAALAALLTRLGAGNDIPIGSPIAGRTDSALDDLVGFFVNTLVLRTDTSGNPSFRELVARVRAGNLSAYSHQDLPFERLVEVLNPARSLSRHPLFQVMLALQNTAEVKLELDGLSCGFERVATSSAKFDLSVSLGEERTPDGAPAGIGGVVEYATDLFDRASVEALIGSARPSAGGGGCRSRACDRQPRHPRRPTSAPSSCTSGTTPPRDPVRRPCRSCSPRRWPAPPTRSRWCTRTRASPIASSMHAPTNWRIGCSDGAWGRMCWWGSASSVRSRWWSGCWLCSKQAAPIVPLDPEYPAERLQYMMSDAGLRVLLTHSSLAAALPIPSWTAARPARSRRHAG